MPQGIDFNNMSQAEQKKLEMFMPMIMDTIKEDMFINAIKDEMAKISRGSKYVINFVGGKLSIKTDDETNALLSKLSKQIEYRIQGIIDNHI